MPNYQRRRSSRRRSRRRGSLGPILRVFSLLLVAVAVVAALTLFFKVEQIRVVGNARYTGEEIVAVAEVVQGDNLILLDKFSIKQRLFREMPYISEVRFDRKLPDTLIIEVTEVRAVAAIQGGGAQWLISPGGKILEGVTESGAAKYLCIKGLEIKTPTVGNGIELMEEGNLDQKTLFLILEQLESRGMLEQTDGIDAGDPEILVVEYDGRFRVELPYLSDYGFKLDCLQAAVASLEPNERGKILMTLKNDNEARFIPEK